MNKRKRRYTAYAAVLWAASIQYYIVQLIAASDWSKRLGYSWANNTISDLANTTCGAYGDRLVCSPLHPLMNLSFIVLGITMMAGAILLGKLLANNMIARIGFGCMILSGIGSILVGLFPENSVSSLHILGATLALIFGNIGIMLIGTSLPQIPAWLRIYSVVSGLVGLAALILFIMEIYLGIGIGGMERIAAYPQSIWMVVTGVYLLKTGSDYIGNAS